MMPLARADLESLLRARKLDRTLTTALPPLDPADEYAIAPSGVTTLDACLEGGFPRGQLCELVGSRSSGRTSVLLRMLAAATARGELVAMVDALDMLDVASAEAAGIDLDRLLWIRGQAVAPGPNMQAGWAGGAGRDLHTRALDHAIKALTLVLQAGNFGLVALDVADMPAGQIRRLPYTTWLRLQRIIEGTQTTCVLVGPEPVARSSAGLTVQCSPARGSRLGAHADTRLPAPGRFFEGLEIQLRVIRARTRVREDATADLSTRACAAV